MPMTKRVLLVGSLALSMLVIVSCAQAPLPTIPRETQPPTQEIPGEGQTPGQETKVISKEKSQEIALNFLRNSPTFRFDGIPDSLTAVRSEGEEKSGRWLFDYQFQSRQAGYGDRSGLMLAQVITDHQAEVIVERGRVTSAILDGQWDELRQKLLK